jgi:hypothetical protein
MSSAGLVTLKQHRFEMTTAAAIGLAIGLWSLLLVAQRSGLAIPQDCLDAWASAMTDDPPPCFDLLRRLTTLVSGEPLIGVVAHMPFVLGLLGGVPIVAREFEARTAPTAWSLYPSRQRWLVRQVGPIAITLGLVIVFTAVTTDLLERERVLAGFSPVVDFGRYGPALIARAISAFGIGLLAGALLGRALPALVLGTAVLAALLFLVSTAREAWQQQLVPVVVAEQSADGGIWYDRHAVITGVAYRSPSGEQLTLQEARAAAHAAGVPTPPLQDQQDVAAAVWLEEHGYIEFSLGITYEMALGWTAYDGLAFGSVGFGALLLTALVVDRKRPV